MKKFFKYVILCGLLSFGSTYVFADYVGHFTITDARIVNPITNQSNADYIKAADSHDYSNPGYIKNLSTSKHGSLGSTYENPIIVESGTTEFELTPQFIDVFSPYNINLQTVSLQVINSPNNSQVYIEYYCGAVNAPTICTTTHQFYLDFANGANGTGGIWFGIDPDDSQKIVIVNDPTAQAVK